MLRDAAGQSIASAHGAAGLQPLVSSGVTRHRIFRAAAAAAALLIAASCGQDDESEQRTQQEVPLDGGHEPAEPETADPDTADGEAADQHTLQTGDAQVTEGAPEEAAVEPAEGFEEIAERIEQLPGDVEALVVEDSDVLLRTGQGGPAPLASVSKVYVMAALVEAVDAGDVDWMDQLEVTDELRSLPSGTLQDQDEGYTTTVYDVAHRMISISDNTGTDMLMTLLGRDAVEDAVAETGHQEPELLRPFLSTRELFQLRWGAPELSEDWEELDVAARREVLEEVAELDLDITSEDTSRHDLDYAVDWYATAEDVAAVTQQLAVSAEERPEVEEILTANPGLVDQVEDEWWDSLAFKGGGLPGVLTGTWHARADDGAERTVVILLRTDDTEGMPDHRAELFSLALDALIAGTDTQREDSSD